MITVNCDTGFYCKIFRKSIIVSTVAILFCDAGVSAFNLDLKSSVSFSGPNNSYYGFTVAQYIDSSNRAKILIGAPKSADESNGRDYRGGAVYDCDVNNPSKCSKIKFPKEQFASLRDNRTDQWLGGTLATDRLKGGVIVVCAPRYLWLSTENSNVSEPVGDCYYTKNGSSNFVVDRTYHPCRQRISTAGTRTYEELGSCQAGLSAAISKDPSRLYIGASGAYSWRGKIFAKNSEGAMRTSETTKSYNWKDVDGYLGYSLTSLNFKSVKSSGIAAGIPRSHDLAGQVHLFNSNLTAVKNLTGEQFASYFGYSMCTSDVDGDGADDLIIGAPLYENYSQNKYAYDTGRIYVYYQGDSTCSKLDSECGKKIFNEFIHIDGEKPAARFGTAITSLGDLNQDGFEDIAVSAPYETYEADKSTGAVYIYLGSKNGLSRSPSQIIRPSDVTNSLLNSFGFSLFGGLDIDGNQYPDLVVGAYESDVAYLLKSRPVIHLNVNFSYLVENTEEGKLIDLEKNNCGRRDDEICVTLQICLNYQGRDVIQNEIEISANITLDTKKPASSRMYFKSVSSHIFEKRFTLVKNKSHCENLTVNIDNSKPNMDKLTSLDAQIEYELIESEKEISDMLTPGLRILTDSLRILKNCGQDDICNPDLNLTITPSSNKLEIPSDKQHLDLHVSVKNNGEDSYNSKFVLKFPRGLEYYSFTVIRSVENVSVSCSLAPENKNITCLIGNPLPENQTISFTITFKLGDNPDLYDPVLDFWANVTSINPEKYANTNDNQLSFKIPVFGISIAKLTRPTTEVLDTIKSSTTLTTIYLTREYSPMDVDLLENVDRFWVFYRHWDFVRLWNEFRFWFLPVFLSSCIGSLILMLITYCFYEVGFFERKRPWKK